MADEQEDEYETGVRTMLAVLKAQHDAMDTLMAMLIVAHDELVKAGQMKRGDEFRPSKSGHIWSALVMGNAAIKTLESALEKSAAEQVAETTKAKREERVPERLLADGRKLWLYPMMYTYRLAIGQADRNDFEDSWCYETREAGMKAFEEWDPLDPATTEPSGWVRHPASGRRRADGDASREEVAL